MPNPLRIDPTRTTTLRRQFVHDMRRRFRALEKDILKLVIEEDAFALKSPQLLGNTRFQFLTAPNKVKAFRKWLRDQIAAGVLSVSSAFSSKPWMADYIESAHRKGVVRAFMDTHRSALSSSANFYEGTRSQFLRDTFAQGEMRSKIELLFTRSYESLEGITEQMGSNMGRILADGMAHGDGPYAISRRLRNAMILPKARAETLARTEIINAHSEGQLDSFTMLGVKELGVLVEFSNSGDDKVCARCSALGGTTYTVEEARGIIPVHPNCRCSWIPHL